MPRDRWLSISSNVHMSDPAEDVVNDSKKGTSDHDPLFRLKPLMTEIMAACKSFYQPPKNGDRLEDGGDKSQNRNDTIHKGQTD